MPSTPAKKPKRPALRRRIPLELTQEELDLLEQAELEHGTKRASLVAGLAALAKASELEQRLEETLAACNKADTRCADLAKKLAAAEQAAEQARSESAKTKSRGTAAERKQTDALKQAELRERDLAQALRSERAERDVLEARFEQLGERWVDALHCGRCSKWARPAQWALHEGKDGVYLYHEPCGLHEGGLTGGSSILAYRDR